MRILSFFRTHQRDIGAALLLAAGYLSSLVVLVNLGTIWFLASVIPLFIGAFLLLGDDWWEFGFELNVGSKNSRSNDTEQAKGNPS